MITINDMIRNANKEGYVDDNAIAKVCQDIVLKALSESTVCRNATIKGGVVMRSLSNDSRRATQDLDIDFIKYSLDDDSIKSFIKKINCLPNLVIEQTGSIKELKQQDYHGKRVYIKITDKTGDSITSKIDLGVHAIVDITQEEYCFDISCFDEGANLLINTKEQILVEKLRSLLRFGVVSTRYKDIYDIWYLSHYVDKDRVRELLKVMIYDNEMYRETNIDGVLKRLFSVLESNKYLNDLGDSDQNWTDYTDEQVIKEVKQFVSEL